MPVAITESIVVGCGAMGRAVAARLASQDHSLWLVSRRESSVARAHSEIPGSHTAGEVGAALRAAPGAALFVTVDSVANAREMLLGGDVRPLLAGRPVFVMLYDEPANLDALATELRTAGAAMHTVGFLATPDNVRRGRAPFLADVTADSAAGQALEPFGEHISVSSRRLCGQLALMSPVLYGSLTVLHAWAAGWVARNGVPLADWFESAARDPFLADPIGTFASLHGGMSLGASLPVDALRREWTRVAASAPALGVDPRVPHELEALLDALAAGPSLDGCFGADDVQARSVDTALGTALEQRLMVSRVGVPSRLVGLGFQLVLAAVARHVRNVDALAVPLIERMTRAVAFVREPVPVFMAAGRFRWTPSLYAEPLVPVGLLVQELRHATASLGTESAAGRWARGLTALFEETAAARRGQAADFTAVYDTMIPPRWSARKRAALADTRRFISPGRVDFFEGVGVPFVMGRRHGPYLADIDDTRVLLNLHCNGGVFNFGHCPEPLVAALGEAALQVDIGNHHLLSERRSRLARRLTETMPEPLRRVAFAPSASEITDFAVRLARAATGRRRVLSFDGSFHGTTGAGAQAGNERFFAWAGPRAPEFTTVPRWDLAALRREVEKGDVAVVLLETVQASSGMHPPPDGFYRELSALCRARGTILALDEVQTGWGRTGRLWAFEHFDVVPDIVILGKGMSGGVYPMAGCCYDPRLGAALEADPFVHQSSAGGSEIGCAVTERILDLALEPAFLTRVNELADRFAGRLETLRQTSPLVTTVHQIGLFISVGFMDPSVGPLVTKACFDRGLLVMFSGLSPDFVQVLPPLMLTGDEADWALDAFEAAVKEVAMMAATLARPDVVAAALSPVGADTAQSIETQLHSTDAGNTPSAGLCASMHPRLLDLLEWPREAANGAVRVVRTIPGLNADVSVVEVDCAGRREQFVMKPLPGFAPEQRFDEYAALIEEYVLRLRTAGIRCLDTWMMSRGGKKTAWVVQSALPPGSLLTVRLPHLNEGARRALFRRIVAFAQAALDEGCGLDAHLANWALPSAHDLDPVMLDVTQPLLRDHQDRIRMTYGAAGVPLFVERYLSDLLSSDLFELRPLLLDMIANLRIDPALAVHERALRLAVKEQTGLDLTDAEVTRATRKVTRMRSALRTLRTLFGDARVKPVSHA